MFLKYAFQKPGFTTFLRRYFANFPRCQARDTMFLKHMQQHDESDFYGSCLNAMALTITLYFERENLLHLLNFPSIEGDKIFSLSFGVLLETLV